MKKKRTDYPLWYQVILANLMVVSALYFFLILIKLIEARWM